MYVQQHHPSGCCCSSQHAIGPALLPDLGSRQPREACTTAVPISCVILPLPDRPILPATWAASGNLYRPACAPWICCRLTAPLWGPASGCLPGSNPFGQGSFSDGHAPRASPAPSTSCWCLQAEAQHPDAPLPHAGCGWCYSGGSLLLGHLHVHSSPAPWCVRTTESESQEHRLQVRPRGRDLQHRGGPRLLRSSDLSSTPLFNQQPQPCTFLASPNLAGLVGSGSTAFERSTMAFKTFNVSNFNSTILGMPRPA